MPIGNLTSQIFANIHLNELDRFVKHKLKVKYYLRYGDDFILIDQDLQKLERMRIQTICFLEKIIRLNMNPKNDKILKPGHGLRFLGVVLDSNGRVINKRNYKRINKRLNLENVGSYYGLVKKHTLSEYDNEFDWWIYKLLESEF